MKDLHEHGILHLDIKPANVLFDHAKEENFLFVWRPVFSDYGLSVQVVDGDEQRALGGTLAFMAPEQGMGGSVGACADVWGLGALLYSLICGTTPLEEVRRRVLQGAGGIEVPPPAQVNAACPIWLSEIVARCVRVDAKDRFSSAEAVLDELLRYVTVTSDDADGKGHAGASREFSKLTISEPPRRLHDGRRHAREVAGDLLPRQSLSELGDHQKPKGGVRVLGLFGAVDQSTSRGAIELRYLMHGKGSSIFVVGIATTTIDGLTFPFNFLPVIRGPAADHESRTVV